MIDPKVSKPISKAMQQEMSTENPYLDLTLIKTISEKLDDDDDIVNV